MVSVYFILAFILYFLFIILIDIFHCFYFSKKCNYDCSICKYWPCPAHRCNKKRFERRSSDE